MQKKNRNRFITATLFFLFLLAALTGCAGKNKEKEELLTILYTNDVHGYIDNAVPGEDGDEQEGMSYAMAAQMKNELLKAGKNVLLIDAGDHTSGSFFGGMDEGRTIINIMNLCGYDLAIPGNHEFDYGMFRFFSNVARAEFPYISCNFYETETGEPILPAYKLFRTGDKKIAIVGISTPESVKSSTPVYFQDENGNYLYSFYGIKSKEELYQKVQESIDAARGEGADIVLALGHIGIDIGAMVTSREIIAHTDGLSAFIDGHSHSEVEKEIVKDASGKDVILTQTGTSLAAIGKMTVREDGTITTELIKERCEEEPAVREITDEWITEVDQKLGKVAARSDLKFWIHNPENPEERFIRKTETNLGDLCTDAFYWYLNFVKEMACDAVIYNGGGIRTDITENELSYKTAKAVLPFGNNLCAIRVTGQQILDALEWGSHLTGVKSETGEDAEFGGFLQISGITYTIDASRPSAVRITEDNMWQGGPDGEYRVKDVRIYDRDAGDYLPLDLKKTYTIGGTYYGLQNAGDGFTMFSDAEVAGICAEEDYVALAAYMENFSLNAGGIPEITSERSPLAVLPNYPIDYESPAGAGRIEISK